MKQEFNPQDEQWYRRGYLAGYTIAFEDFKARIKPEERLAFESWLQKELLPWVGEGLDTVRCPPLFNGISNA